MSTVGRHWDWRHNAVNFVEIGLWLDQLRPNRGWEAYGRERGSDCFDHAGVLGPAGANVHSVMIQLVEAAGRWLRLCPHVDGKLAAEEERLFRSGRRSLIGYGQGPQCYGPTCGRRWTEGRLRPCPQLDKKIAGQKQADCSVDPRLSSIACLVGAF